MGSSVPVWSVTVVGLEPYAKTQVYTLMAIDDNAAARAGIDRFVEEMRSDDQG